MCVPAASGNFPPGIEVALSRGASSSNQPDGKDKPLAHICLTQAKVVDINGSASWEHRSTIGHFVDTRNAVTPDWKRTSPAPKAALTVVSKIWSSE